jgi:peptidyl-tRNA hydrolase
MSNLQEELLLMGFEENMAQLAVANCNNGNLEDAINWILACSGDGDQSFSMAPPSHESLKLVLVVRSDLQMSAGKMAAQCVHAALAVARIVEVQNASSYANWRDGGEATICLRCASEEELNDLEGRARASGSQLYLYRGHSFHRTTHKRRV